jgi:hypothetical protein
MIINNEFLNELVRQGEGLALLTTAPSIDKLIDPDGQFLQKSDRVPLIDGLRAIVRAAEAANGGRVDPDGDYVLAMDRSTLNALLVSLVRLDRQGESILPPKRLEEELARDKETVEKSHKAARRIAALYEKEGGLRMEDLEAAISKSAQPALTRRFLADAGRDGPELVGPDGPLPRIEVSFPETLTAGKRVSLTVNVLSVRERECVARVKIVQLNDLYTKQVLGQQSEEISLLFDASTTQFKDLTAAQYLGVNLKILAVADCPIDRRFARKGSLTLCEVQEPRLAMDKLHVLVEQLQLELDFGGDD